MNGTEPNEPWWIELFEMYYLGCYGDVCRYRRTRNLYVSLYFFFFLFSLSVSTLCRIAFRKAMRYIMNSNGSEQNKVIFTHPTECRRVWLRGLGDWLNSRPYSWIFNLLSGFQASLLFIFFRSVTNGTKPITYVCFTFEIGAAQPRFITDFAPPQRFFCVNRSRLWYDFHGGVEAVRSQSMNIASSKSQSTVITCGLFCATAAFLLFLLCFCWRLFQKVSFSDSFLPLLKFSCTDSCSSYLEVVDSFLIWTEKKWKESFLILIFCVVPGAHLLP